MSDDESGTGNQGTKGSHEKGSGTTRFRTIPGCSSVLGRVSEKRDCPDHWTLSLVAQFIEREWKETYTLRGASKLLHSLGLSYTRPTYTLQKADPVKQNTFVQETFPSLKKS